MNNWHEYVGHQPLTFDGDPPTLFVQNIQGTGILMGWCHIMAYHTNWKQQLSLRMDKEQIDIETVLIETEDTIGDAVEEAVMTSFPTKIITNPVELILAKNDVAVKTRRSVPNVEFNGVWWYQGNHATDRPIYVLSHEGKYGIWKHPLFEDYGFRIVSL